MEPGAIPPESVGRGGDPAVKGPKDPSGVPFRRVQTPSSPRSGKRAGRAKGTPPGLTPLTAPRPGQGLGLGMAPGKCSGLIIM